MFIIFLHARPVKRLSLNNWGTGCRWQLQIPGFRSALVPLKQPEGDRKQRTLCQGTKAWVNAWSNVQRKCNADPGVRKTDVEGDNSEDILPCQPRQEQFFRNGEPYLGKHIQMVLVFYLGQLDSLPLLFTLFGTDCLKHYSSLEAG